MHKTANVLNYLPKSVQAKAKQGLQAIWMAETRERAHQAFDQFVEAYEPKYPKATNCLSKHREALLAFYDFPAEHWVPAHDQSDRINLRDDSTSNRPHEGVCDTQYDAEHDLQAQSVR